MAAPRAEMPNTLQIPDLTCVKGDGDWYYHEPNAEDAHAHTEDAHADAEDAHAGDLGEIPMLKMLMLILRMLMLVIQVKS